MIVTELYNGQGLGNQLWCYVVTRIIAEKKGFDFGIMSPHKFKGKDFINLDFGKNVIGGFGPEGGPPTQLPEEITSYYREKMSKHPNGIDISKEDKNLFLISDNTKIDGNLQSFEYIKNYKNTIKEWIKIKDDYTMKKYSDENVCIIHIRGGDFKNSSAFLTKEYYEKGIEYMLKKNDKMRFYIITDDINFSRSQFPNIEIIGSSTTNTLDPYKASHHIGGPIWIDWLILFNSKNVILSASSFGFWPTWLNNNDVYVIAPMFWADYKKSDGYWSCGDSLISDWNYIDRNGNFYNYENCLEMKKKYENKNMNLWN